MYVAQLWLTKFLKRKLIISFFVNYKHFPTDIGQSSVRKIDRKNNMIIVKEKKLG